MKNGLIWIAAAVLAFATLSCSLFTASSKSEGLQFSPAVLPDGQVGQAYQALITLTNQRTPAFDMSAAADTLPPGLTGTFDQDKQTYTLSGTPTQAGSYSITLTARCYGTNVSGQSGAADYKLVIR
jgi:hypothetical protein